MKIRIAIIAACAVTLALAQVDVARAQSTGVNTTQTTSKKCSGLTCRKAGKDQQDTSDRMGGGGGAKGGAASISDQASGGILTKKKN